MGRVFAARMVRSNGYSLVNVTYTISQCFHPMYMYIQYIICINYNASTRLLYAVIAAVSVANIVKSSLGPVGLDKMLVDDVGVRYIHVCEICTFHVHVKCT